MSHWNYRILRKILPDGTETLGMHEVYYSDEGIPNSCTEDKVSLCSESTFAEVQAMQRACTEPVLDYQYFLDRESEK